MAITKIVAMKNPTNSSTSKSETSHSPSPKNQDKGKGKAIHISFGPNFEATMTITPLCAKVIVIGSPKRRSLVKDEKYGRKRQRPEYVALVLFQYNKL